jgi:hypothetical protein
MSKPISRYKLKYECQPLLLQELTPISHFRWEQSFGFNVQFLM